MKLVIVESPAKAKTIETYLGKEFKVIASKGHIFNLPKKDLGIDINNKFKLKLVPIEDKKQTIDNIKKLAKKAEIIYLAADDDREGEAIAFHVKKIIGKHNNIVRVKFNAITKESVKKAIENPVTLNKKMYASQQSRRIIDRLVGYKISPILWNKFSSGLSAGRVQSVALKLVVQKEDVIDNFVPEQSFSVTAFLKKDSKILEAKYLKNLDEEKGLKEKFKAEEVINKVKDKKFTLMEDKQSETYNKPSAPFSTSKLQQAASSRLGFSTSDTMRIAQKLYEGVHIQEKNETVGLITYMRTDSLRTDPKKLEELRLYIKENIGEEYLSKDTIIYKKKGEGKVQDAHEAIRPTYLSLSPEKVRGDLSTEMYKLYKLIYDKFVSSQMASEKLSKSTLIFQVNDLLFESKGSIQLFDGFKKIWNESKSKDVILPKIEINEELVQSKPAVLKEHWTKPPQRYTEATLVKDLEEHGIGRPSTYATIISNIINKEYIVINKGKIHPTRMGISLSKILSQYFKELMNLNFTSDIEKKLDLIEEGSLNYVEFLSSFWKNLSQEISSAYNEMPNLRPSGLPTHIHCPNCDNKSLIFTYDYNGTYLLCEKCKEKYNALYNKKGSISLLSKKEIKNPCPLCGNELILREGKYGAFYSCSSYPKCNYSKTKTTGVKCHICKKGEFVARISKNKKKYWTCSNYPDCKTVVWDEPIQRKCTKCFNTVLVDIGDQYKCPKCNHREDKEKKEDK